MIDEPRFGTDGVRGIANKELTPFLALRLGMAAASVLGRHSSSNKIVVGRDTRLSGEMLESALAAGLASMGAEVHLVGVIPTPGVARSILLTDATAGAVISASHNPYEDNGIKFFGGDARKLSDTVEEEIEYALENWLDLPFALPNKIGRIQSNTDLAWRYQEAVSSTGSKLTGLKLVIDCANGAASAFAPSIFTELGADVIVIHNNPDGVNINANCGSTRPSDMRNKVVQTGADAGLAFDGDCDRVMMCDELGHEVDGDHMMALLAKGLKLRGELNSNTVVATIMSNAGLDDALDQIGVTLMRTDVGDRYVAEAMQRSGAVLGGEKSGHVLLPKLTPTGDGIVTGLRVLAEMVEQKLSLSQLAADMVLCPQKLRGVKVRDRQSWQEVPEIMTAIEDARKLVGKPEWLSVRASGTEPLVRVMAQDHREAVVDHVVSSLCELIGSRFGVN